MEYNEEKPVGILSQFIKLFWSLEYDPVNGSPGETETVLPDGCPEIVFNLSDRFKCLTAGGSADTQPAVLIAGQMSRSITITPTGRVRLFGIRFQPAGAVAIGRLSMHELTDSIVDLSDILGADAERLTDSITASPNFSARIAAFTSFYHGRLISSSEDMLAAAASRMIVNSRGLIKVSPLAERLGVSERRLERRFRSSVGISPKALARIVRFQAVARAIQNAENANLVEAALDFGYFDQSHMIRDFRELAGETPLAYFDRTHRLSDLFVAGS